MRVIARDVPVGAPDVGDDGCRSCFQATRNYPLTAGGNYGISLGKTRGVEGIAHKGFDMRRAVYAGSFDPLTNGHLWMIECGARLFDELIVAVGNNPDKHYTFSLQERVAMTRGAVAGRSTISVDSFEAEFLVRYARFVQADYILRGIRNVHDYDFERGMRNVNDDLEPSITSVFLMPPREMAETSSSLVKGLIGPKGWPDVVRVYVPASSYEMLIQKFGNK